jgi:hypothetical protein
LRERARVRGHCTLYAVNVFRRLPSIILSSSLLTKERKLTS